MKHLVLNARNYYMVSTQMKAAALNQYGPPEVVEIEDVERPVPGDNEVLVKIRAASINPLDWHGVRGKPYIARLMGGLSKPKDPRLGVDMAGQVEAVGRNVNQFRTGDEVFGMCKGALAEYVCISAAAPAKPGLSLSALAIKPVNLTFEEAAAVPVAGLTALQGLHDKGHIQPGQKVLINGAAGGVGTFAVQIAKSFGADVTGVCGSRNIPLVQSLGADTVIDYTKEDFTRRARRYDLFLDCVGNHSLSACRRVLNVTGTYVVITGPDGRWLGPLSRLMKAILLSRFVPQKLVPFIANANRKDLGTLRELIETAKVKPIVDRCYKLSGVREALRYLEEGHASGKVVVTLG